MYEIRLKSGNVNCLNLLSSIGNLSLKTTLAVAVFSLTCAGMMLGID